MALTSYINNDTMAAGKQTDIGKQKGGIDMTMIDDALWAIDFGATKIQINESTRYQVAGAVAAAKWIICSARDYQGELDTLLHMRRTSVGRVLQSMLGMTDSDAKAAWHKAMAPYVKRHKTA